MVRKASVLSSMERSPGSVRPSQSKKRTRSINDLESSADGAEDGGDDDAPDDKRRLPGVKRACNECRQQKLRCDVVQEPFAPCSRCSRLNLECKIESNFKRVGKRSRNAEIERQLNELRRQLETPGQSSPDSGRPRAVSVPNAFSAGIDERSARASLAENTASEEAVASLLDLRQRADVGAFFIKNAAGPATEARQLETVTLAGDRIQELFNEFFASYHPSLPLLDPSETPDGYFKTSPVLFWTIVSVASRRYIRDPTLLSCLSPIVSRLLWTTLREVPQSFHVVKALCLLCTWPLPVSTTSADPTFMLSGIMMHVAMQIGLHRPSHAQDFARFRVQLRDDDLRDRIKTWAACNVVAQCVGTGYGQRPPTMYDWTLEAMPCKDASFNVPADLAIRVRIEKFCDRVTMSLYGNRRDPVGLIQDGHRYAVCSLLEKEFKDLEGELGREICATNFLYLRAAELHLRLSVFFDSPTTKTYHRDLLKLYFATTAFLEHLLSFDRTARHGSLAYATNYILQMTVAAGFTLHKLLNSFFAAHVDLEGGRDLFRRTIDAIRAISVMNNDLPARLAEVLAQLWQFGGAGSGGSGAGGTSGSGLMLKVRCRMSMSLVYDSVWRWREEFQAQGRANLDANVTHPPSYPGAAPEPLSSSFSSDDSVQNAAAADPNGGTSVPGVNETVLSGDALLAPGHYDAQGTAAMGISTLTDTHYEVFDPLNWMFDGYIDFPSTFPPANGGAPTIDGAGSSGFAN